MLSPNFGPDLGLRAFRAGKNSLRASGFRARAQPGHTSRPYSFWTDSGAVCAHQNEYKNPKHTYLQLFFSERLVAVPRVLVPVAEDVDLGLADPAEWSVGALEEEGADVGAGEAGIVEGVVAQVLLETGVALKGEGPKRKFVQWRLRFK